jgi:hypothetical protein
VLLADRPGDVAVMVLGSKGGNRGPLYLERVYFVQQSLLHAADHRRISKTDSGRYKDLIIGTLVVCASPSRREGAQDSIWLVVFRDLL